MPRRLLTLVLICLLLSVLSTVAASWLCAAFVPYEFNDASVTTIELGPLDWDNTFIQSRFGLTYVNRIRGPVTPDLEEGSLRWQSDEWRAADRGAIVQDYSDELRAGWPFRAFRCTREDRFNLRIQGRFGVMLSRSGPMTVERGIELAPRVPGRPSTWRALPYDPIWPGLLGNIALHALAWGALLTAPIAAHRAIRRRRGLCPQCGYPIGVSPRCTECGARLPHWYADDANGSHDGF